MRRDLWSVCLVAALMAGCGSSVKLDDVPVEDKSGTAVTQAAGRPATAASAASAATATDAGATNRSGVAAVDLGSATQQQAGPAGLTKVLYFDYDSFVVKPEFQSALDGHARFLKANASRRIVIEGHTDERGGREYNLALGQKRSEAVRRALGLLGVPDSQIEAVSFGKEKPAATGADEASFAKNRRAELAYR